MVQLSSKEREAWTDFIHSEDNLAHMGRESIALQDLDAYVATTFPPSEAIATRVKADIGDAKPNVILDLGCSTGVKCLALHEAFPDATIYGIEPEKQALDVGISMVSERGLSEKIQLIEGIGEAMPYPDNSIDLIICHTVIEHVQDVQKVIAEIARVLAPGGMLHIEAPNYNWPYEPHIQTYCVPRLGKTFCRLCAKLQGKGHWAWFLPHLQFVHPRMLEQYFRNADLEYDNIYADKIRNIASGKSIPEYYRTLGKIMRFCRGIKLDKVIAGTAIFLGIYPSVMYLARKK